MNINEIYDDLSKTLCNQDKVLKELIWFINRNKKLNRPKNALLIGEFGTGKTTIVEQISQKMKFCRYLNRQADLKPLQIENCWKAKWWRLCFLSLRLELVLALKQQSIGLGVG